MLDLLDAPRFIDEPVKTTERQSVGHNPWTIDEEAILRRAYPSLTKKAILRLLPGRTWDACKIRATRLEIRRDRDRINTSKGIRWTERQEQVLCLIWKTQSKDTILRRLKGHSWSAINTKASKLGLSRDVENTRFTPEELDIVASLNEIGRLEAMRLLPRHGIVRIYRKARELGLEINIFPDHDLDTLEMMNKKGYSREEMATMLGTNLIMISRALKQIERRG